jgi:hypothetical protein
MKVSQKRRKVVLTLTPEEARTLARLLLSGPEMVKTAHEIERAASEAESWHWWRVHS